jgi:hydroxymethylbilane synthase
MPVAAWARPAGDVYELRARLLSEDGRRMIQAQARGSDPADIGARVIADLNAQGAADILAELV